MTVSPPAVSGDSLAGDPSATPPLRVQLARAARLRPSLRLVLDGEALALGELERLATGAARALRERGVAPGDVVMTLCENGPPIVITWWACVQLGAVFAPLNARLEGAPLGCALRLAGGAVIVCDADRWQALAGVIDQAPSLRRILLARGRPAVPRSRRQVESLEDLLETATGPALDEPGRGADQALGGAAAPARLLFTSGTTGDPKAVLWSRRAEALHAARYGDELVRVEPGETVYSCLPLFHVTCQGTLLGTVLRGGSIVVDRRFDPLRFWKRTREEGAVFFPYVGTVIAALLARPRRADDAQNPIRRAMGSAAPAERWAEFEERFGLVLEDVWGQTETASCWTRPRPGRRGGVGEATDRFQARIVSPAGPPAPPGGPGELWIRPREDHTLFEGYLGGSGSLEPGLDADGWYHTGDLLSQADDGLLHFHGRLREAIRRRGETISPAQIEAVALAHPEIVEAAAVGVGADDGVEDEIMLWAVVREGAAAAEAAIHRFLRANLPRFMTPRFILLVGDLPKTATSRVQRTALRQRGSAGAWDARTQRRRPGG